MSKLKELIQQYCPDGVEYKKLGEIATIERGNGLQKKDFVEDNPVCPCIHYGQIYTYYSLHGIATDHVITDVTTAVYEKNIKAKPGDIVMAVTSENIEDVCKCVVWQGDKDIAVSGHTAIIRSDVMDTKFLAYYFYSSLFYVQKLKLVHGTKVMEVTPAKINDVDIPVPPLPVQQEIVRILDSFTELEQEVEQELEQRKKQYEYYINDLMRYDSSVPFVPLGELFSNIRNGFVGVIKPYFTDKDNGVRYLEGTNIHNGVISDNEELYVTKEFHQKHIKNELKADDILMVQSGHIGECAVVGDKYAGSNCHALIIMSNGGRCNSKFYTYYFHSSVGFNSLAPAMTGGTVKHVLAKKVKLIKVPFPSLAEQNRVVVTLDNFNSICTDLTSGLPAEIALRKKQYEYYRDKLLTFKRKEA